MGSYNTIMFLVLLAGAGLLWLISLLYRAAIVDVANQLINIGIMSTYTANALDVVMTLATFCLPAVLLVLVVWYVSGAVGQGDRI